MNAPIITVLEHNKAEWSRMAKDAYANDLNDIGHRYSVAASVPAGYAMTPQRYEELQGPYREWLNWGWKACSLVV